MWGKLKVWGTDQNGYWEHEYGCFSHEINDKLKGYEEQPYDDYDFYEKE